MEKKNVLLLGVNGYLGSTIFESAKNAEAFDITGAARGESKDSKFVRLDVTNYDQLKHVISKTSPAIIIWSLMDRENERKLIDRGLNHLLQLVKKDTKLVYLSTDAIFFEGKGGYKESDLLEILPLNSSKLSEYAKAKLLGENIIKEKHPNHLIIRCGPLYGTSPNGYIENRTQKLINLLHDKKTGAEAPSNVVKTFTHVKDLANAVIELCQKDFVGTIHLGPSSNESYYTFYMKRLKQLAIDSKRLKPICEVNPCAFDTSLDTSFTCSILKTKFRVL